MTRHSPPLVAHVIYALTTGGLENGLVNIINRYAARALSACDYLHYPGR